MSLFSVPDTVPSRVLAVYRYLLRARGQRESRETLKRVLMPEGLPLPGFTSKNEEQEEAETEQLPPAGLPQAPVAAGGTDKRGDRRMIEPILKECVGLGLLVEDGDEVALSPELPEAARDPKRAEALAQLTLCELLMKPGNERNHDLLRAISWYLAFDPRRPPADWRVLDVEHRDEVRSLRMNNSAPYGQLRDWTCFLGFGWTFSVKKGQKLLIPDPTEHLRLRLPGLFSQRNEVRPFAQVLSDLARQCGVFEGGIFRRENESAGRSKPLEGNGLTRASAHAWLRLQEEGVVKLGHASDADAIVLPEEDEFHRYSQVEWLGEVRG